MLNNTDLSVYNYDNTLIGWADPNQTKQSGVTLGAASLNFCNAYQEHDDLQSSPTNWTINDAGPLAGCIPFITKWKTNISNPNNKTITIPAFTSSSYTVDWGDGTTTQEIGYATHTFPTAGFQMIKITGDLDRIQFFEYGGTSSYQITEIIKWGNITWESMYGAFTANTSLTIASDAGEPNLSPVTTTSRMFEGCSSLNSSTLNNWDVSNVTNMSNMFRGATSFNQSLGSWNVSSVTNMSSMFDGASSFDQSLGSWNVSNVTTMANMLDDTNLDEIPYDDTLTKWSLFSLEDDVPLGVDGLVYGCNGQTARTSIINLYNWTITGDASGCRMVSSNPRVAEDNLDRILVYPNPAKDYIKVKHSGSLKDFTIKVIDMAGRVILRKSDAYTLDISNLKRGVYFLQVKNGTSKSIHKFIKE
jgi:surface protein